MGHYLCVFVNAFVSQKLKMSMDMEWENIETGSAVSSAQARRPLMFFFSRLQGEPKFRVIFFICFLETLDHRLLSENCTFSSPRITSVK